LISDWEIAHIAYAVDSIDDWMPRFSAAMGGRWTTRVTVESDWRASLTATTLRHVTGSCQWLSGPQPPIELWEGPKGSPWYQEAGSIELHHIGYWGIDLPTQVAQMSSMGYELEVTPGLTETLPATDGEYRGFAYLIAPGGMRIEIQRAADKPDIQRWLAGGPLQPTWDVIPGAEAG
jgi:hypothetical protein